MAYPAVKKKMDEYIGTHTFAEGVRWRKLSQMEKTRLEPSES